MAITKKSHIRHGFTIVELLIVIVVIAILATITIVAYNGIQQRATTTKTKSMVKQAVTALEAYKVVNGHYPEVDDDGLGGEACLGSGYPGGVCGEVHGCGAQLDGDIVESAALNNQLSSFLQSTLPAINFPDFTASLGDGCGATYNGVRYSVGCYMTIHVSMGTVETLLSHCGDRYQAYDISYFVQGDVDACGNTAIDFTDVYKNFGYEAPDGWRVCYVYGGDVRVEE